MAPAWAAPADLKINDLGPLLDLEGGAFMDTGALMQHLDLVITPDTAVAHLAGALGRPVWMLVPFVPDWRWLTEREDSVWYPSMRLFRQSAFMDWPGVFTQLKEALDKVLSARSDP